ncbi:MAG: L-histidine N(alpha)-methyltransferase [Pyrinomonadaceae bacterium]
MSQTASQGQAERLRIHRLTAAVADDFAADVRQGLTAPRKFLLPKYFYDELGSRLFDAICLLPEYYLTRAEAEIFTRHAAEIVERARAGADRLTLFELGSGSAAKTRRIIDALLATQPQLTYVPVDISTAALEESASALLGDYTGLSVTAYAADYDTALPRLRENFEDGARALVLFLGSNIGNFDRAEARSFLRRVRKVLRAGDCLLLGVDLKKHVDTLEAAYDDTLGVTSSFNRNLLARINRDLRADFSLSNFSHRAFYNAAQGRVEMHLESYIDHTVRIGALALAVRFRSRERIHTENSYKYSLDELSALAAETGFDREHTWLDPDRLFSSNLFVAKAVISDE